MKVAYLCLAHNKFDYLSVLADHLTKDGDGFFLHVDSRVEIPESIKRNTFIKTLPCIERYKTRWGTISIVDATISLLKMAQECEKYDYYILISGHDYPLWSAAEIKSKIDIKLDKVAFWEKHEFNPETYFKNPFFRRCCYDSKLTNVRESLGFGEYLDLRLSIYINRLIGKIPHAVNKFRFHTYYKGSQWFGLSSKSAKNITGSYSNFRSDFINIHAPDEIVIHTLLSKTEPKFLTNQKQVKQALHYIDWNEYGEITPFVSEYIEKARSKGLLFARKVDFDNIGDMIDRLDSSE
ncbi:beta-1,6-N-acetylglucosaminyltransferase [Vibrio sp. OPT18]|uniref:beta-1,6-N-acetylglucosaminyltransferase n=1 Tax=Vibrio sp. OPT18 TaxID=2778641 RepID=UPI00187FE83D|nr:beta-1,6-N-acetylglucosaminyltransferase [Vibrio sp. OPT18]MBE8578483.1 hypothetical protein [Vibrio sp. OPT18]